MQRSLFLCASLLLSILSLQAQSYSVTTTTGTYADLEGSTSLNGDQTWDDPSFDIPIGFDFNYFNTSIDTLYLSAMGLGGLLSPNGPNETFTDFMNVYGADIIDRGWDFNADSVTAGSQSTISYVLEGSAGNQILKVEWKNVGFYSELEADNVSSDFTNFQLWLYEGSDQIELRFGPNSISQPELSYEELPGSSITFATNVDFENELLLGEAFSIAGDPTSPQIVEYAGLDTVTTLSGTIPNGTIYTLTNQVSSTRSLRVNNDFALSPNPADMFVSLSNLDGFDFSTMHVSILNASGQKVQELKATRNEQIDISDLRKGVYFVQVRDATQSGVQRLLVR